MGLTTRSLFAQLLYCVSRLGSLARDDIRGTFCYRGRMPHFLAKTEPTTYSIDDLERDHRTASDGVAAKERT
jgi:hypothetical protein